MCVYIVEESIVEILRGMSVKEKLTREFHNYQLLISLRSKCDFPLMRQS